MSRLDEIATHVLHRLRVDWPNLSVRKYELVLSRAARIMRDRVVELDMSPLSAEEFRQASATQPATPADRRNIGQMKPRRPAR